jgi:hypothetical protein
MKIHLVFHVSLLEPYYESRIPGQVQAPLPPIQVNGEEEFEVEEILDSKIKNRVLYFLIHWQGYDISECTWEPIKNLTNAQEALQDFHKKNTLQSHFSLLEKVIAKRGDDVMDTITSNLVFG